MSTALATTRAKLLKQMTPATAKAAEELAVKYGKAANGVVMIQYDVGTRLSQIAAAEAEYGSNAVAQLADYLRVPGGETGAYSIIRFATTFDKKYVAAQMETPMMSGDHLTTQHWVVLSRLADESNRDKMLKRVLKESLSANDLEKEIRSGAAGNKANGNRQGGRNPKVPSNPIVALQRTYELSNKFCRWETQVTGGMITAFDELEPEKITKDALVSARKTDAILTKVAEQAGDMQGKLAGAIERMETVLAARKAGKGKKKVEDEEADDEVEAAAEAEAEEDDEAEEAAPKKKAKQATTPVKKKKAVAA